MADYRLVYGLFMFYAIVIFFITMATNTQAGMIMTVSPVYENTTTETLCSAIGGICTPQRTVIPLLIIASDCNSRIDGKTEESIRAGTLDCRYNYAEYTCCVTPAINQQQRRTDHNMWEYSRSTIRTFTGLITFQSSIMPFWINFLIFFPFDIMILYLLYRLEIGRAHV